MQSMSKAHSQHPESIPEQERPRIGELLKHPAANDTYSAPDRVTDPEPDTAPIILKYGSQLEIAQRIADDHSGKLVFADGAFYLYDPHQGYWPRQSDTDLLGLLERFDGCMVAETGKSLKLTRTMINGVAAFLRPRAEDEEFFQDAPLGTAFTDCFVAIRPDGEVERRPHSPHNRARFAFPFSYDLDSSCASWQRFLGEVFSKSQHADDIAALLGEFIGACIVGNVTVYEKALLLIGEGSNGKSVLCDVVSSMFPKDSQTAIAPQYFSRDYHVARLAGARVNIVSEIPSGAIMASDRLKAAISGDLISARDLRKSVFCTRLRAGNIFAGNELPQVNDQTDGFWRRWICIEFNRAFKGEKARKKDELTAELKDELPGIVAWAIAGAARLFRRGHFEIPPSCETDLRDWRYTAEPVAAFLGAKSKLNLEKIWVKASLLYRSYCVWAKETGHKKVSMTAFGKRMKSLVAENEKERRKEGQYYKVGYGG